MVNKLFRHYRSAYTGLPKTAWILALIVLINRSGTMVVFFLTLYLTQKLNFSVTQAGKLFSLYGIGALVGTYLGGWLSDIWGTYKVQVTSLLLSGIAYIALGYINTFYGFAVLLMILAVVCEAFRPANIAAIAKACPVELRPRGFTINRLAVNLGVTVGPALGGLLAMKNYSYLFWVDGITSIAAAVVFLYLGSRMQLDMRPVHKQKDDVPMSPFKDVVFMFVLLLLLLTGMMFFQFFNTWPLYLRQKYALIEAQIGTLMGLNALIIVLVEMPLIHSLERRKPLPIISLGVLFVAAGFVMLPYGNTYLYAALAMVLWTIGEMLVFPLVAAFIANLAHESNQGKYMGMFSFTFSIALVIGPGLGAWVYDHFGPVILWYGIGVTGLIVFSGFQIIHKKLT
ncbi:MFS transporter [candidate division KSB1 bacterium]|nr:MFS transporter [candidate division KSB1 bacterium]